MGVIVQLLCTLSICSMCMSMGILFAWPSSTLRLFESTNTTLNRPMTEGELALFGSLSSMGALIGTPALGLLLDRLGRKPCSIITSLLGVLGWTLVAVSSQVEVLLFAMFVAGVSGSSFLIVPNYISEICQESIRGAMTAGTMISYGIGMLLSYLLGGLLSYHVMIYTCLSISVASTAILQVVLKESPTCLMIKGLEEEAAKSIAYYRSLEPNSKEVQQEVDVIRRGLNPDLEETTPENEKLNNVKSALQTNEKLSTYQFIKKSKSTRRALYLTFTLITLSLFQGLVVLQVYAEPLFVESISCLSPTVGSLLLAVVAVLAGVVAAYLTEYLGRRPLMIYASFITAAFCVLLGLQMQLKWGPDWLLAVNMYLYTTAYSIGAGTVPYVLVAEVFLPEVKCIVSMLVIEWAWFCNFAILFIFNPLLKAIGMGPIFYIFASISVATGVYATLMQPETKGLATDEIQEKLMKNTRNKTIY